eukprot:6691621-Ditylum_brightwellii.AAC.1
MGSIEKATGNALKPCMSINNGWKDSMGLSAIGRYKDSSIMKLWHRMVLLLEQDEDENYCLGWATCDQLFIMIVVQCHLSMELLRALSR